MTLPKQAFIVSLKFIQYTINYFEKDTNNKKKNSFRLNECCRKYTLFFSHQLQLITVLVLICDCYMGWSTRFITSLKVCVGFSIFDSVLFILKFIFLLNRKYGLFDFKGESTKNCESIKKGKLTMKIFLKIILNKVLNPQCWHFCKWWFVY